MSGGAKEINILGFIPARKRLRPLRLEILRRFTGRSPGASDKMNRIGGSRIGTMTAESALSYLRKAPNKALITGGDRGNMALAAWKPAHR